MSKSTSNKRAINPFAIVNTGITRNTLARVLCGDGTQQSPFRFSSNQTFGQAVAEAMLWATTKDYGVVYFRYNNSVIMLTLGQYFLIRTTSRYYIRCCLSDNQKLIAPPVLNVSQEIAETAKGFGRIYLKLKTVG